MLMKAKQLRSAFAWLLVVLMMCCYTPGAWAQAYQIINAGAVPSSLNVPGGRTYVIQFTAPGGVNMSGNLTNYGNIYVVSTNPSLTTASITAQNIYNAGLLTSILPPGGLPGIINPVANLNLSLSAINSITNLGTISAAGSLAMQAQSIMNAGAMIAQLGTLNAYTSNLINSGIMQAMQGSATIANPFGSTLTINNAMGTIAARDSITMQTLAAITSTNAVSKALLEITGGNLEAPQIAAISPGGQVDIDVDNITGGVSVTGGDAVVQTKQSDLRINSLNLSGDPILGSTGNLDLSGLFSASNQYYTYGAQFVGLAGKNIWAPTAPAGATINAESSSGVGGRIVLESGTLFNIAGNSYTIIGPSATGGDVYLPNVGLVTNNNSVNIIANGGPNFQYPGAVSVNNIIVCCNGSSLATQNVDIFGSGAVSLGNITNQIGSIIASSNDTVSVATGSTLQSFRGDVSLTGRNDVDLGSANTLSAVNGSLLLTSQQKNVLLGSGNTLNAFGNANNTTGNVQVWANQGVSSTGSNKVAATGGNVSIVAAGADVTTGSADEIKASFAQGHGGSVTVESQNGNVAVGSNNKMDAVGGNLLLRSSSVAGTGVSSGQGTTLNAFAQGNVGAGTVYLTAPKGPISVGTSNSLSAVGGDTRLRADTNITTGDATSINAYRDATTGGGSVQLQSANGSISIGTNNSANAVGGDLGVASPNGTNTIGSGSKLNSFESGGTGGNVSLSAVTDIINGDIYGGHAIVVLGTGGDITTATGVNFQAQNGAITFAANNGNVNIGDSNTFNATGGDILLQGSIGANPGNVTTGSGVSMHGFQSAAGTGGNITLRASNGDVSVGATNDLQAKGGDLTLQGKNVVTGAQDTLNAFHQGASGGSVALNALSGNVQVGANNVVNATGGNASLGTTTGSVTTGDSTTVNAFDQGIASAGSVIINGPTGVNIGTTNKLNAVGGDVVVNSTAGTVNIGTNSNIQAFTTSNPLKGTIAITSFAPISWSLSSLQGQHNVQVIAPGVWLENELIAAGTNTGGGGIMIISTGAANDFRLTTGNQLLAYGDIVISSARDILLGSPITGGNVIGSKAGDVNMTAARNMTLGAADNVKAQDGNVNLTAQTGNITLGSSEKLQAGGGNLVLTATAGNVDLGTNNRLDAYAKLSNPAVGGSVIFNAPAGNLDLGTNNVVVAAGGTIVLNSPSVDIGTGNQLWIYGPDPDITITLPPGVDDITGKSLTVGGANLILTSNHGLVLNDDVFIVVGGNLSLINTSTKLNQDLYVDMNNYLAAYSTAWLPGSATPPTGGNVYFDSSTDIRFGEDASHGGPSLPDEQPSNYIQATGGNIVIGDLSPAGTRRVDIFSDNVFVASSRLPDGTCGPGGGMYIFSDTAVQNPLPTPGALNEFFFTDAKVNIAPQPWAFSSETSASTIHQFSPMGSADPTDVLVQNNGAVKFVADNSLIHVLSSDFLADRGIVYFRTGGDSAKYEIQFKDSSVSAGCVPYNPPPPPPAKDRPLVEIPSITAPIPPTAPTAPDAKQPPTAPTAPAFPTPPTPGVCPAVPTPPPSPPPVNPVTPVTPLVPVSPTVPAPSYAVAEIPPTPTTVLNPCLAWFVNDAPESYLQATSGTQLRVASNKSVEVRNGIVLVGSGPQQLTVASSKASVTLKHSSIGLIEAREGEPTTITALAGTDKDGMTVHYSGNAYTLHPGDRMVISDVPLTSANGVSPTAKPGINAPLQGRVQMVSPVYMMQASVSLPEFIPKIGFLQCRECALRNYLQNSVVGEQGIANIGSTAQAPTVEAHPLASSSERNVYQPVAFSIAPMLPADMRGTVATMLAQTGADRYMLSRGSVLVHATRHMRIDTPQGSVYLKPGPVVMITASKTLIRVRDISDDHNGDVAVVFKKSSCTLGPGREVAVVQTNDDALPAVLADGLSRRDIRVTEAGEVKVVTDDFSILHAMLSHPLLEQVRNTNDDFDRRVQAEVIKAAAAISMVMDRVKGPYYVPTFGEANTGLATKPFEPLY